ncbi:hypothetical protein M2135_002799 [Parabacteroides sp. PF5-9]|nr:hypothetical protein [Parabacteroides sp. PF5-9]
MNHEELYQKRVVDCTVGELVKVLTIELREVLKVENESPSYSYKGVRGIMDIFQCSKSKAMRIRVSGIIDDACIQTGNSFLVDKNMALNLMRVYSI